MSPKATTRGEAPCVESSLRCTSRCPSGPMPRVAAGRSVSRRPPSRASVCCTRIDTELHVVATDAWWTYGSIAQIDAEPEVPSRPRLHASPRSSVSPS